jgi:hypothetical protein
MAYDHRDPDRNIVAIFKQISILNEGKSQIAGRPIHDDVDVCELRFPGSRNTGVYPAESFSHWATDIATGTQYKVTYAERFPGPYRQFKERALQTKSGTPLDYALFLTEARRAELRALNIYTIEALAAVDGQELKNLGPMGRDAKNRAIEYLEEANKGVDTRKLEAELLAARERNAVLEEDLRILKAKEGDEGVFAAMTTDQLKDYIAANTGQRPLGNPARKTLLRMAEACTSSRDSAA